MVGGESERDHARAWREESLQVVQIEGAIRAVDPRMPDVESVVLSHAEPLGDVRVVIEFRDDDLIACLERSRGRMGQQELQGRGVRAEGDLLRVAAHEVRRRAPCLGDHRVGLDGGGEGPSAVRIRVDQSVRDRVEHLARHLGSPRAVEERVRVSALSPIERRPRAPGRDRPPRQGSRAPCLHISLDRLDSATSSPAGD